MKEHKYEYTARGYAPNEIIEIKSYAYGGGDLSARFSALQQLSAQAPDVTWHVIGITRVDTSRISDAACVPWRYHNATDLRFDNLVFND